ncbi:hypothetical protein [Mesorhizobium sp. 2RAF21]
MRSSLLGRLDAAEPLRDLLKDLAFLIALPGEAFDQAGGWRMLGE